MIKFLNYNLWMVNFYDRNQIAYIALIYPSSFSAFIIN